MFIKKNSCASKLKLLAIAISIVLSNLQLVYANTKPEDCEKSHRDCDSGARRAWGYLTRFGEDAENYQTLAIIGCNAAKDQCLKDAAKHAAESKDKK